MDNFKGNYRYLYDKQDVSLIDISKAISKIDKYIIESKALNLYTDEIILEFFHQPGSDQFKESHLNIGRYITGYEQAVFNELEYKDYTQMEFESKEVEFSDNWENLFHSISENYLKEDKKWKLIIKDDFSKAYITY